VQEAVSMLRPDGEVVRVDVDSIPVPWHDQVAVQLRLRPVAVRWDAILHAAGAIATDIDDAVVVTDLDLRIVRWNDGARDLYGWEAEDLLGRHLVDVVPWDGEIESLTAAARELQVEGRWRGRARQRRRDGSVVEVDARTQLLHDHEGRPVGIASVNATGVVDVRDAATSDQASTGR
jgi:PAS domain S-box-containing protein